MQFLTIINRAAGGGRCGKQVDEALQKLRAAGFSLDIRETQRAQHATEIAREAYAQGHRSFLSIGGDGTTYEVINGLFPLPEGGEPPTLAIVPMGTGNSFLRDFGIDSSEAALEAILRKKTRACDVIRCEHEGGSLHYINLLSVGFSAVAGELTNRRFKSLGALGYIFAVVASMFRMSYPTFSMRNDDAESFSPTTCTLLSFSNSRYTGGTMMMAPKADVSDGLLDIINIEKIKPLQLGRAFPKIFKGTHVNESFVTETRAKRVEFEGGEAVPVMVDGEILSLSLRSLEVLPSVLNMVV